MNQSKNKQTDEYFEDGYYYPPAPVMETINVILITVVLTIVAMGFSLTYIPPR